jgi:hypothetical protein
MVDAPTAESQIASKAEYHPTPLTDRLMFGIHHVLTLEGQQEHRALFITPTVHRTAPSNA